MNAAQLAPIIPSVISVQSEHQILILGLDVSPLRIGYALIKQDETIVESGTLHVPKGDDLRFRRAAWQKLIRIIEAETTGRAELMLVAVEDAHVGINKSYAIKAAVAIGHVEAFAIRSYPWVMVHRFQPAEWRKIVGIGTRSKEVVMEWARGAYDPALDDQDEADALGIAVAGARELITEF